jgi:hypothetical protein
MNEAICFSTSMTDYIVMWCEHDSHDYEDREIKRWDTYYGLPTLEDFNSAAREHWTMHVA